MNKHRNMIGISEGLRFLLTSNNTTSNDRQEAGSTTSSDVTVSYQKRLRQCLILPFSIICNILFLVVAFLDFKEQVHGEDGGACSIIRFKSIDDPVETPLLFLAFTIFGVVLLLDLIFITVAICQGGRKKLSQLAGPLVHHCGFLVWVIQILLGHIPYTTGVGYCLFLLEFSYPQRIIQSMIIDGKNIGNEASRIKAKAMIFGLDMFCSGGGTFVAISYFIATLSFASADIYWRIFWTYLLAIVYWFFQLFTFHRRSLERILRQAGGQDMEIHTLSPHEDLPSSEEIISEKV